jgi:uncharacterized protein (TIGR03437 family)
MKTRILSTLLVGVALVTVSALAAEIHTGWWHGRKIAYKVVNGRAIWQGDMVIRLEDIASAPPLDAPVKPGEPRSATFIGYPSYLWPNATVPYAIGSAVSAKLRTTIANAIQIYSDNTPIRWVPRTNEANYVMFRAVAASSNECGDSLVGMQGGSQDLNLSSATECGGVSSAVHEMGHTIGFEHEMTRANRNFYVNILYQNMDKNEYGQFDQDLTQVDLLPYDYGSIMHYGGDGFMRNDFNTIATIPPGIVLSNNVGLSAGDAEAVRTIYGSPSTTTTIATNPVGLKVVVDGQTVTGPQTFNWAQGSQHTLSVASGSQPGSAGVRYVFARWSNDAAQSQTMVVSTANRLVTANFAAQYQVPTAVNGGGTISVSPSSPDGYYTQGTLLTVTATPNAGFTFVQWSGTLSGLTADSDNPTKFTLNDTGLKYTANFAQGPVTTIGSSFSNMTAVIDGQTAYLPSNFSWTPGSKHTIAIKDATQPVGTSGLPYQYVFLNWSNGGANSQTITAGAASTTITAMWKRQFLVSTYVNYPDPNGANGGAITVNPHSNSCFDSTDCYYDEGATITLTAMPTSPYAFAGWSGDLSGTTTANLLQVNDQIVVTGNFQIPGTLNPFGVVSAANYTYGTLSPGEIITIFGLQFGPQELTGPQVNNGVFATTLAQTRVLFDGVAAPLLYVAPNQISAIVPYEVSGKPQTTIQVQYQGRSTNPVALPVDPSYPALFTMDGSGGASVGGVVNSTQGAILNQNGSVNSSTNPASRGSVIVLFGTGEGMTTPAGVDGKIAATTFPKPLMPVTVTIGGRPAQVQYAGTAPLDVAGVLQINATVPMDCPEGSVPIGISVGNYASPDNVTLSVQ